MLSHSQEFADAVRGAHESICRAEVERDGQIIRTLDVTEGVVDADYSALNMRRFTASVVDTEGDLTPADIRDLLAPFGTIIRLYRGVRHKNGVTIDEIDESDTDWYDCSLLVALNTNGGDLKLGWGD